MRKNLPLLLAASFIAAILAAAVALGSQHSIEEESHMGEEIENGQNHGEESSEQNTQEAIDAKEEAH